MSQCQRIVKCIYRDRFGVRVQAFAGGVLREKHFPASTPLKTLEEARDHMKAALLAELNATQRPVKPAFKFGLTECLIYFISDGDHLKIGRQVAGTIIGVKDNG